MAEKNKLLELIGDNKELKATLGEMMAASRAAGVAAGKAERLRIVKAKEKKEKGKVKSFEPEKPDCFKSYKKSFENHPAKCRGCFSAQACKGK